jgi:exosortase
VTQASRRWAQLTAAAAAAAITLVYLPVLRHGVDVWRSDQELSFGFLVPPVAAALLASRLRSLLVARADGQLLGLAVLAAGLLLLLVSSRSGVHALAGASLLPVLLGATGFLYGGGVARLIAFPAALLAGGLSLYRGLLDSVGFGLQLLTAQAAAAAATQLGVPVRRSGVDLFAGSLHLVVVQACSGMDSLLALLCLGALFVGLAHASLLRRAALIGLVLPIILAANVLRVTLVVLLSRPLGLAVVQGALHEALSASLFVAATLLFAAAGLALRCVPSLSARPLSPS